MALKEKIIDNVYRAGVVGKGGAGFPTHIKLKASVDTVIANGAECEPLLYSDQTVMTLYAERIIDGLTKVIDTTGASKGIVALKKKYKPQIKSLESALKSYANKNGDIEIQLLDSFYPSGDEHILVSETTDRVIPEIGLPLDVGCVVSNVASLVDISRAQEQKPVTHKWVTVMGEVHNPAIIEAPIGTQIKEFLDICKPKAIHEDLSVIDGGPLMGFIKSDFSQPIIKTTSGLIFLKNNHPMIIKGTTELRIDLARAKAVCCQCRMCTDLCPRYLQGHRINPHLMMRSVVMKKDIPEIHIASALLCSQCGVCEVIACQLGLSPKRIYAQLKQGLDPKLWKREESHLLDERYLRRVDQKRFLLALALGSYDVKPKLITTTLEPEKVFIPLKQHLGVSAEPIVKKGQKVITGDTIAAIPEGKLGAPVHASIDGVITIITSSCIEIQR
jgi:Na+-translocating ferredoxin:NAD+ oxidoreductase RnfC subunit